jgi:hypothetical protein
MMLVQTQKNLGQAAGHFADPDHRDVKPAEDVLMPRHGRRQFAALIQAGADVLEQLHHRRLDGRCLQPGKRTQMGTPALLSVYICRENIRHLHPPPVYG